MKIKKLLAIPLALLAFTSCGKASEQNVASENVKMKNFEVLEDGVLTVGTSVDFPPYEYYEGNDVVGIDPEILEAIGDKLGVDVKFEDMEFNNIIASIQSGRVDIGAAGLTVNEERKKNVDFTDFYGESIQVFLVKNDSDIKTIEDVYGKKIGTQLGSVGDLYAKDDFGEDAVSSFSKYPDAVLALQNGNIDAILMDQTSAVQYEKANDDIKILDGTYTNEQYAFAVAKGNEEFLAELNNIIAELKEDGTIDSIFDRHMNNESGSDSIFSNKLYVYLIEGLKITLLVTAASLAISFVLGLILALIRTYAQDANLAWDTPKGFLINLLDKISGLFLTIIRGTPTTIQLLIMFNVIMVGLDNLMAIAIATFSLNSAAYMAEVFRGGINSVDKGEIEAARSLGLSYKQTTKLVTLPQAFKNSLPALGNEVITLLKETSISGFIGLTDLTRGASIIISKTFKASVPYFAAALIYLVIVIAIEQIFKALERKNTYA